ncbi:GNAT family N-acetyltransferase [Microbacterium sulfonylureivorans]|uniref:GNAT family N-acetyltransferase n=1 Tax=Microbacterium sulfonylureivorans TaxID=2486854 RepID=UPI000FD7BE0F|nr:GNAT family N-acetyltransferase [Microbacterium sulfonylureivorans]
MRPKLLRLADLTESDFTRWSALSQRAAEANAALDPRFLAPERLGEEGGHLLLVAEEGDRWFGLLRVFPTEAPTVPSLQGYGTWDPPVAGPSHPVLDRDRATEALATIARGVRSHLRSGYLTLRGYPATGPLADALAGLRHQRATRARVLGTHSAAWAYALPGATPPPAGQLILPADIDPEYRSYSSRRVLRTSARRLAEAAGGPLTLHDATADPAAIDRFVAMQASGWKGNQDHGGTAVALDDRTEQAFRDKVEAFGVSGDLKVLELWAGARCVYSTVVFVAGGVAVGYLDAYQHEFGRFSAGSLARTAVCAHLRTVPGIEGMNPGIYDQYPEASKIYPDRREFLDVVIGAGIVPSAVVGMLPRAERSSVVRRGLALVVQAERFAMRATGALRRRLGRV